MKVLIINGPNLNKLGDREPSIYGSDTLEQIINHTETQLPEQELTWFQSNHEGEIVSQVQDASEHFDGLVINPAGYSHTSVAILDALKMAQLPKIEVHLSQIYQREDFRTQLLTAKGVDMIMGGLGKDAYIMAVKTLILKGDNL